MNKTIVGAVIATSLLYNLSVQANEGGPGNLNFAQSLELAIIHDQDLQAAEFQYQSTLATRGLSKAALLPQLNFSAFSKTTEQTRENSTIPGIIENKTQRVGVEGYTLSLTQTIYNHGLYKKLQQTDMSISAATATLMAARQDLILRLATAYFNVLGAKDNLKFSTAEMKAIEKQLEQSKKRFEVGLIAITDVKEAQASYDTSTAQEIDAQNILAAQLEALAVILGVYTTEIAILKEDIPLNIPEPANIKEWTNFALENNTALKAAEFSFQAAMKQVDADQSGHYPYLDLQANHSYSSPDGGDFAVDSTDTALTVQLTVPIYSGGFTSAKHRQSVALKEQTRSQKEKARRQAIQQTRDAYLGVTSTIAQVKALKQALISNQAAHEATQAGFEVGTRTAIDVLSTLREVYRAERDYARARYNYVINTLRLRQASGLLTMEDGKKLNIFLK